MLLNTILFEHVRFRSVFCTVNFMHMILTFQAEKVATLNNLSQNLSYIHGCIPKYNMSLFLIPLNFRT